MIRRQMLFAQIILFLFWSRLAYGLASGEQFPFLGVVTADRVNLRAGPNINFEKLFQLNKGGQVVVVNHQFSWYKVKLPSPARCFISGQFITVHSPRMASVKGKRVKLRAGPGERYNVLGKVRKGTVLRIYEQVDGWYRIAPSEGSYGWISDQYVTFKSSVIPRPRFARKLLRNFYHQKQGDQQKIVLKNRVVELKGARSFDGTITVQGQLVDLGRVVRSKQLRYKLIVESTIAYYLEGDSRTFNRLINQRVAIKGKLKDYPDQQYNYPVLTVEAVQSAQGEER